jgi:nitrosocyanin
MGAHGSVRFGRVTLAVSLAAIMAGCLHGPPGTVAESVRHRAPPVHPELTGTVEDGMRVVRMSARQFGFSPATVVVRRGDRVRIDLFSADVTHGLSLSAYGIRQTVDAGKTVSIQFVADRAGEFTFRCPVFCGWKWLTMRGRLIVAPNAGPTAPAVTM